MLRAQGNASSRSPLGTSNGGGLHYGGCLFSLHSHCGKTLASCLGGRFSTLHLKVKYPLGNQSKELVESQSMARQCLVAAIMHQLKAESSASVEGGLIAIKGSGPIYRCSVERGNV